MLLAKALPWLVPMCSAFPALVPEALELLIGGGLAVGGVDIDKAKVQRRADTSLTSTCPGIPAQTDAQARLRAAVHDTFAKIVDNPLSQLISP